MVGNSKCGRGLPYMIAQDQMCNVLRYDDIMMPTKNYIVATPVVLRYTKHFKSRVQTTLCWSSGRQYG